MNSADLWSLDRYEYGFRVWRRWRKCRALKAETMVLDARYFMLVVEGEGEVTDHGCGPDCACFEKKENP